MCDLRVEQNNGLSTSFLYFTLSNQSYEKFNILHVMDANCKTCHSKLIQKNRMVLFLVGIIMLALAAVGLFIPWLWVLSIPLSLVGGYLFVWATLGKGLWCRQCKKFAS
jgi:hypothetical protein